MEHDPHTSPTSLTWLLKTTMKNGIVYLRSESAEPLWYQASLLLGYYLIGSVLGLILYAVQYTCQPQLPRHQLRHGPTWHIGRMALTFTVTCSILAFVRGEAPFLAFHEFMPKIAPFPDEWEQVVFRNLGLALLGTIPGLPPSKWTFNVEGNRPGAKDRLFQIAGQAGLVLITLMPLQSALQQLFVASRGIPG